MVIQKSASENYHEFHKRSHKDLEMQILPTLLLLMIRTMSL